MASPNASRKLARVNPAAPGTRTAVTSRMAMGTTTRTARIAAEKNQTAGAASSRPRRVPPPPAVPAAAPATGSDPEQLAELLLDLVVSLLHLLGIDLDELQLLEGPLVLRVGHGLVRHVEAVVGEDLLGVLVEQEVREHLRRVRMRRLGQDGVGRGHERHALRGEDDLDGIALLDLAVEVVLPRGADPGLAARQLHRRVLRRLDDEGVVLRQGRVV